MLDHIGLAVTDAEKSKAFYEAALAPIGLALQMTVPGEHTAHGRPDQWSGQHRQTLAGRRPRRVRRRRHPAAPA